MEKRSNINICFRLIGLVKPLMGFMLLAIFMGVIGHLSATFITILGGYAILDLLNFNVWLTVGKVFVVVCILAGARGVLHYAEQAFNHYIAFKLLALIRDKVFRALRRLAPAKLEVKDKGNLISVITSDIELLEVFYAHTISPIAIAFIFTIIMCVFIAQFHWMLALLALIAYVTVGIIIPVITSKKAGDTGLIFRNKSGDLSSYVLDNLRGLSETIQYNMGDKRLSKMNKQTDELSNYQEKMQKISGRNMAITNTVILIFDIGMLALASVLFVKGQIEFTGLLISVIGIMSSFGPVVALSNLASTLQSTFASGNRVLDILDEQPVIEDVTGLQPVVFSGANTKNVTFSYGDELVLSDVSVDIPKYGIIGIVGKSGSGKSTLLKLLMRFWDTQQGSVNISNTNIKQINTTNLREMESFVTQDTHLFNDSIANNVRIAKLDATDEEIRESCKKASIHDFIKTLPDGYNTPVGELGDLISGGERQRIGLARAFLHNAPFLLLDEPTSNLDSLNEAVILKSINEERGGKTVVLVSHRESTMRIADAVYSVEHGRSS